MTVEHRAAFARRLKVNKSTITRAAQAGRLVLTTDGLVDVEASLTRWAETMGSRDDVAARHAAQRGTVIPEVQPNAESLATAATDPATSDATNDATASQPGGETRANALTRKESAAADLLEMEKAKLQGKLIPKEDVDTALKAFATATRSRLDVLADQLAPVVAPVTAMHEVHALLSEYFRQVLAGIADDLQRHEASLVQ